MLISILVLNFIVICKFVLFSSKYSEAFFCTVDRPLGSEKKTDIICYQYQLRLQNSVRMNVFQKYTQQTPAMRSQRRRRLTRRLSATQHIKICFWKQVRWEICNAETSSLFIFDLQCFFDSFREPGVLRWTDLVCMKLKLSCVCANSGSVCSEHYDLLGAPNSFWRKQEHRL